MLTTKTKVLKILDKYRDMSLTMGCEFIDSLGSKGIIMTVEDTEMYISMADNIEENEPVDVEWFKEEMTVLGHPATPLTLLKALNGINEKVAIWSTWTDGMFISCGVNKIQIPDVTTLSEIPEEDKMWQAVLDVLIID